MVTRESIVDTTNGALGNLYHIVAGLYEDKARYSRGYPIIAEGWVGEIFKLRKQIDDMIGLTDYVERYGVPSPDERVNGARRQAAMTNGTTSRVTREEFIDSTNDALGDLYNVLAGIWEDKVKHGNDYPIVAGGRVSEIFKLRKELDNLIGLTDYVAEFGSPPTDEEIEAMSVEEIEASIRAMLKEEPAAAT